jgi:RNA polymerase sigma factor
VSAERKLLNDALDRTGVRYETESWMDEEPRGTGDSDDLRYRLLMQNLEELETSLVGKYLEMDILAQLGALGSFNASVARGVSTLDGRPDGSLLDDLEPETTPLDAGQEDSQVVVIRSGAQR